MKKMSVWLFIVALAAAGCASQDSRGNRGLAVEALPEADIAVFLQLGHSASVNTAVFSPDGKYIVSGANDATIKLWETASGREIRTFEDSSNVHSVAFSPDGKYIVSGSETANQFIKLWDVASGQEIRTFKGHSSAVQSLAFSADGKQIVSGSDDKTVKLWNVASGRLLSTFKHSYGVSSVAFSPDGTKIVSGSRDRTVKIWDTISKQLVHSFYGSEPDFVVRSVAFSPDGKYIASGAGDHTVKVWDAVSGRELYSLKGHSGSVSSVVFSPDGKQLASAAGAGNSIFMSKDEDNTVKLWDATNGRLIRTFPRHSKGLNSVAFSPDGKQLASAAGGILSSNDKDNNIVKLWDVESGREIRTFSGMSRDVASIAFSPDREQIVSGSGDGEVRLWNSANGQLLRTFKGHSDIVCSVAFSPDGKQIVSGSWDDSIKLWDTANGQLLRTFKHLGNVWSVAFSPDGKQIISASSDRTVKLWDVVSGKELSSFPDPSQTPLSAQMVAVAFSPDGNRLVTADGLDTVRLWDVASRRLLKNFKGHSSSVHSVAFSPNGKQIVSGSYDKTVKLWDVDSGRLLRTFKHSYGVSSVAFSPDGKQIVSGSIWDIKLWDTRTGREMQSLSGHSSQVNSVAFSPDGKRIVSGSQDFTVRLWNATTGAELARFISFSGTDTQIASATRGLTVETEAAATAIDGEWLAITPEGYYQASPQGDRYINVRVGNTVSGIDAYRSVLYNPDVVQARLAGKPDPASKGAVTIQQAASFAPPAVTIRSPAGNTTTTSASTTLSVSIADLNQPIQNIKIMVNGRILGRQELSAVTGTSGLQPQKASFTVTGNQKTVEFQLPLSLDPGPNRIEVVAFNGFSESRRYADLTWNAPAGQRPALPNLWILAVGVNGYADSNIRNLNYCVADAKSVVDSLKAQEGKRYGKVNSLLIADDEGLSPTAANIRQNLGFLEGAGPRDVALLFLAGHGVSGSAGAFFFLPADTRLNADGTVNPATAVTGAELFAALDAPGNRLVFIDACQSGGVDNDRLVRYLMDTNAFVFASSRGNELSQERPEFGHGVFTYSILNAIKGATAARAEGNVSVLSLSGFVSTDVPRITDDRQHPSAYSLGFYDFPLAAAP